MKDIDMIPSSMLCFVPQERKRKKNRPAHVQCVNVRYDGTGPDRSQLPVQKISWTRSFPEYIPCQYTSYDVLKQPRWADPPLDSPCARMPAYNQLDGPVDRRSNQGDYKLMEGVPRNPRGRTGMIGRGVLGRWGPNHTATPIITRWSRDSMGDVREINGARLLEVVAVKSRAGWGLPCELVVPGDRLGLGTRRAFLREMMKKKKYSTPDEANQSVGDLFGEGTLVYKGYVDDAKNTDNAWLETIATNYHDCTGERFAAFRLSDEFTWVEATYMLTVFSQHKELLKEVVENHRAHW